jgi:hypothetical protein
MKHKKESAHMKKMHEKEGGHKADEKASHRKAESCGMKMMMKKKKAK